MDLVMRTHFYGHFAEICYQIKAHEKPENGVASCLGCDPYL